MVEPRVINFLALFTRTRAVSSQIQANINKEMIAARQDEVIVNELGDD